MWQHSQWAQCSATASQFYQSFNVGLPLNFSYQLPNSKQLILNFPSENRQSNIPHFFPPSSYRTSQSIRQSRDESNTIEIMELDQYYTRARFGDWAVHFRNIQAIPTKQVEAFFAQFGDVRRVTQTGDSRGLCFVNFHDEESAKKCAEALINHETYRLRKVKEIKSRNDPSRSNINKSSDEIDNRNHNLKIDDDGARKTSEIVSVSQKNLRKMDVPSVEINKSQENSIAMDLPPLIPTIQSENAANANGRSVMSPSRRKPMQVITAQEVIVANVPEDFGVAFILHLLEKLQPICASAMKIEPIHSVRYCHIYFKTVMDAKAAEAEFDNAGLEKNHLIVLTTNSLAMQAALPA